MQLEFKGGKWEGLENMLDEEIATLRQRAWRLVKDAVLYAEGELKTTLTGRRSGRSYKISKTGKLHVASKPGEAPAVLFGGLRNSVGHTEPEWDGDIVGAQYGPGLGTKPADPKHDPMSYAVILEFGGIISARMQRVKEHWRRIAMAFGRPISPRTVLVGTFTRQTRDVKIEPRPYMAPTEERIRPVIEAMFEEGI